MNIVYISKYVLLPEYGSPTRQYFIAKYLSRLEGNKTLLIGSRSTIANVPAFKGLFKSSKNDNLQTITLNGPNINLGFNRKRIWSWIIFEYHLFKFRKKIKESKPDVIIVSSLSILTFVTGVFLKRWLKAKLVIEIRDIYPLTLQHLGNFSPRNPVILFLKWVEKFGYKNADLIVSTLPNAKEHIGKVLQRPFQFYWLPMGIDPEFFEKNKDKERRIIQIKTPGKFEIMYAGSIGKANALEIIFEAAEVLEISHPHLHFSFIGDGPLKNFYKEKYGHIKSVGFISAVSKEQLPNLLKQADLLINTWLDKPIYKFGISPNKWMDYMFAEKPILIAFSGYRCIIEEAGCGVFIPAENKDALVNALIQLSETDHSELEEMGKNGKRYLLKNFTYEKLAKDYNKKLHSLIFQH